MSVLTARTRRTNPLTDSCNCLTGSSEPWVASWASPGDKPTITATGDQSAIDRWLPTIRDNKPSILCELHRERRRTKVLAMLEAAPGTRYAVHVADASTDPVVVAVGIREIASFELEIPHQYYDGMVLLELIEKYSGEK